MPYIKTISAIGAIVMAVALFYGFTAGGGWAEVRLLTAYPWFNVSLIDVYVGFALFCTWIAFRERLAIAAIGWIVLVLALGNLITCAYVLIAALRCGGDAERLLFGARFERRRADAD